MTNEPPTQRSARIERKESRAVAIRFCGDSGDGMQLVGTRFTDSSSVFGNDFATLPDYPSEIRAPAGSLVGVSGFQINFSSEQIHTPGDLLDALVAMNPAALKKNHKDLALGGIVVANEDAFTEANLQKAGMHSNPLVDGSLHEYRVVAIPMEKLTLQAAQAHGLNQRDALRCKNFFALGVMCWLYERPLEPIAHWIQEKLAANKSLAGANTAALKAGWNYCDTVELFQHGYRVAKAAIPPGRYRKITGNEALAMGLVTAARLAGKRLFYGSYPITPASAILETLAGMGHLGVRTFQAEDEIAAITSAIGASFAGDCAATGTSGPGLALKTEAIGLAVSTELPLVIIDVQRCGPSTGLPTKTEQSDYFQAVMGRNGECPVAVLAAASPADCFDMAMEAMRIAVEYMTPVILLADGYLGNGSEPWRIPNTADLPRFRIEHLIKTEDGEPFKPYKRNERGSRPWVLPGTEGMEHRIGGLEKQNITGVVNQDPANHQLMVNLRAQKIANIADSIPDLQVEGNTDGDVLVLGWGSTYGSITTAVKRLTEEGRPIAHAHLHYLNPMPSNTGDVLSRYKTVLIPELNTGQLLLKIRGEFLVDAQGINKVEGRPFLVAEIEAGIRKAMQGEWK